MAKVPKPLLLRQEKVEDETDADTSTPYTPEEGGGDPDTQHCKSEGPVQ